MKSLYTQIFRGIKDLNFQMEILEHFNWDEEESAAFNKMFSEALNNSSTAEELKIKLSDNYSDELVDLVFNLVQSYEKDLIDDQNNGGDIEA